MVCIYCGQDTAVTNSRPQKRTNTIWRRRQCKHCQAIFTTTEGVDTYKSLLVRQPKGLEPFQRDKLFVSVHDSLRHRKSALPDATGLTETIISDLYAVTESAVIERLAIIAVVTSVLERFDSVAATHYAAFHP